MKRTGLVVVTRTRCRTQTAGSSRLQIGTAGERSTMGLVNTFDGGRVVSGQDTGANGSEVERTLLFQEEDNNAR